jgi:uncharacterized protein with FMN-binding domain
MKGLIMNCSHVRTTIPALVLSAAASIPAASALAASNTASKSLTFTGSTVQTRWTPMKVSIVVKNKKITTVNVAVTPETARSSVIESQALPILKQEVLQSQSANINEVSGATDIFSGYVQSLQSAIRKAQQARALK